MELKFKVLGKVWKPKHANRETMSMRRTAMTMHTVQSCRYLGTGVLNKEHKSHKRMYQSALAT